MNHLQHLAVSLIIVLIGTELEVDAATPPPTANTDGLVFQSNNYIISIPDTTQVGNNILSNLNVTSSTITPSDLIEISCSARSDPDPNACSSFQLLAIRKDDSRWIGSITLAKSLNALAKSSYLLTLVATKGSSTAYQNVNITVVHAQLKPPQFQGTLSASTPELDSISAAFIILYSAVDADGLNRPIRYRINSNPGDYFRIEDVTGRLFNTKPIQFTSPGWELGYVSIEVEAAVLLSSGIAGFGDPTTSTKVLSTIYLLESVDYPPVFDLQNYTGAVDERSPVNTVVKGISLNVTDRNRNLVNSTFELVLDKYANVFKVAPNNASQQTTALILVANSTLIDYDAGPQTYYFNVIARETLSPLRLSSSALVTISLFPLNDYAPVFSQSVYSVSISELINPGQDIFTFVASDRDVGRYGNISIRYKFVEYTALFRINAISGVVTIAPCSSRGKSPCIDFETVKFYQLPVIATDNYGEGLAVMATLNVTIIDENDNLPIFTRDVYYGQIDEHQTIPVVKLPLQTTSSPLQVNATDADSSLNGYNNVTYSIIDGNNNNLWSINPVTGIITANRPVNYTDTQGGYIYLTVQARDPDPTHTARAAVNITVIAVNFYPPVFENNKVYNTSILETTPPGSPIIIIKANDGDSTATPNGIVRYRFLSGNQDMFTINDATGQVSVSPTAKLDAVLNPLYTISLQASDLGNPSMSDTGTLYINIIPNRPDPKFTPSDIRPPPILESSPIGQNVTVIFADNTNPNKRIYYSFIEPVTGRDARNQPVVLTPAEKQLFAVDPVTGIVTVKQPLNYDRVATWIATVQAVDNNTNSTDRTGTAMITITVLPVNKIPPVFNLPWTNQTPTINKTLDKWDTPNNNVFNTIATSPNSSLTITYQLLNDYGGAFNISPQTSFISLVKPLNISMDTDVKLVVIAVDNGQPPLTSTATILVQLKNTNNFAPQFTQPDYLFEIADNITNGTVVLTVHATDPDYGDFGQVRYAFINSPPDNRFQIDPITGVITVAPNARFNGSIESLIILRVRASDSPNDPVNSKSTDTTVQLSVYTINTIRPRFSQATYSISIPESSAVNSPFIQVLALKDNTFNSKFVYGITDGNNDGLFAIDPDTGAMKPRTSLVGHAGTYSLTVSATDNGKPPLMGTASVSIQVLQSSYRIPTWVSPSADGETDYINEKDPRGTFVTRVNASNTNSPGKPISYYFSYITGGASSNTTGDFDINAVTGVITTARDIGYEGGTKFVVNVFAVDDFNTFAKRVIVIVVQNILWQYPSFPVNASNNCTLDFYGQISKNAPNNSIVDTLAAFLADPNDPITYRISFPPNLTGFPFEVRSVGIPTRAAQIVYFGNQVITTPKMYNFIVTAEDTATDLILNVSSESIRLCYGVANQTNISVHINVVEITPQYDADLHTCIRDDADIGTSAYKFTNLYPDSQQPVKYRLNSVQRWSGMTVQGAEYGISNIFNVSVSGEVVTLSSMSSYDEQYFQVKVNSTFDYLTFADPTVTIYVVPYAREVLMTFNQSAEYVKRNIGNVIDEISNLYEGAKVCVVSYQYHVTDEGVVDPTRTDVLLYVINGNNKVVYPSELDSMFTLGARKRTSVIGITEAYSYWAGFIYHPVAIAIGIILGLLVLALILFCCCCFIWSKLLALCRYTGDKEPLIYKASSLGVVNPVWTPKPETEEQILTMPVHDGDGANRTIELLGEYGPPVDIGDEDVIDTASRFQSGSAAASGAQSLSGYVHIEAPLTASRSPSAFGNPSAYGHSQMRQETTTTYENSTTSGAHGGRESPYPDSHLSQHTSGAMDSHASYSASGAMKYGHDAATGSPPPRSHSTGTMTNVGVGATVSEPDGPVRLNDPGDTVHAKIGATLFRPGGQAYAQSVISGTTMGDQYDTVDDTAGLYGAPHDARLALPLDTEVMYSHMRPTSYYDDADIMPGQGGMYQGEVRVGRGSMISEQLQETRFM